MAAERRHRRPRDQQIAEDAEQSDKGASFLAGRRRASGGARQGDPDGEEQGAGDHRQWSPEMDQMGDTGDRPLVPDLIGEGAAQAGQERDPDRTRGALEATVICCALL